MAVAPAVLEIMRQAATSEPLQFVEEHVLSGSPFACSIDEYLSLTTELATKLNVAQPDVRLVGSAKLGFSLNPDHLLRPFGRDSDLDFVVVASELFDQASLELVAQTGEISLAGEMEKRRLRKTRENVFNGFLRADQLPMTSSLSREWFPRLAGPFDTDLARRHPVKAWLFKSIQHARIYYTNHHGKIQSSISHILTHRGDL
jgi:hypothetical protein